MAVSSALEQAAGVLSSVGDVDGIAFHRVRLAGREAEYMAEAAAGERPAGGCFSERCQAMLEAQHGGALVLPTASCTAALEIAAVLLRLGPGDEFIVPSFTHVATASAFCRGGARPVFADIDAETLCLDPDSVRERTTAWTRAIVVVNYGGIGSRLEELRELAAERGIALVEDNAHGLFGCFGGRSLGTFGALSAVSFHETKNLTCGQGGALVLNDASLAARAKVVLDRGTNRARFLRGEVEAYEWVDHGSNFAMSEIHAAFLCAQLEEAAAVQRMRREIWQCYDSELDSWRRVQGVGTQHVPAGCEPSFHLFALLLPSEECRAAFQEHLRERRITAPFHFPPLHLSPMGRSFGGRPGDCPVSETVARVLVRLPIHGHLDATQQDRVISAVREFSC